MKSFFLLVLLVAVLSISVWCCMAEDDDRVPCDMPDVWMGDFHTLVMDDNNCFTKMHLGAIRYDYRKQKMRIDYMGKDVTSKMFRKGQDFINGTLLYDFEQKMGYHLHRNNESCTTFKIKSDMMPPSIPDDAEFLGLSMIGGQALENWFVSGNTTKQSKGSDFPWGGFLSFTEDTCLPITFVMFDMDTMKPKYSMSLWNVVPGVIPFSFEVPELCKEAKEDPMIAVEREDMGPLGPQIPF
jgi:hypothetical protein